MQTSKAGATSHLHGSLITRVTQQLTGLMRMPQIALFSSSFFCCVVHHCCSCCFLKIPKDVEEAWQRHHWFLLKGVKKGELTARAVVDMAGLSTLRHFCAGISNISRVTLTLLQTPRRRAQGGGITDVQGSSKGRVSCLPGRRPPAGAA